MQRAECKVQSAECRMQNAECRIMVEIWLYQISFYFQLSIFNFPFTKGAENLVRFVFVGEGFHPLPQGFRYDNGRAQRPSPTIFTHNLPPNEGRRKLDEICLAQDEK